MIALIWFVLAALASPFKSKTRLEAENAVLRHQLIVLRRKLRGQVRLTNHDRRFFVQLYRWFPAILTVLTIIRPRDPRALASGGLSLLLAAEITATGRAPANRSGPARADPAIEHREPDLGAPRIHGELLKLGFKLAQSSVAKYMVKHRGPPSQGWRTFLRNRAPEIAAMDLFLVPTIGFDVLYAFVIVRLDRRDLVWINVTTSPTAEWVARGFSLGHGSALYDSRSGPDLRRCRYAPIACHGHPGPAHSTSLTLAEWLCRAADRIDPPRVC